MPDGYTVPPIDSRDDLMAAVHNILAPPSKGPAMTTEFPALAAHARQHGWPDEAAQRAVRERAGMLPEYDNEFEAQRLLRQSESLLADDPGTLVVLAEAQARATLHLAKLTETLIEEQRLSNLIAWSIRPGFKAIPETQKIIEKGLGL